MKATKEKSEFESSLKEIELIVQTLEQEALPLEMALKKFEEGAKSIEKCRKTLSEAELTVKQWKEKGDTKT